MPLPTEALKAANVHNSANPYLRPLWNAVNSYNNTGGSSRVAALSKRFEAFAATRKLPPASADSDQRRQALALQDIMYHAAGFLTCKPPKPEKEKRHPRWDAMSQLMTQVHAEAARIGVKLVDSPTDFRTVSLERTSFWLEVIDPRHREGGRLSELYQDWLGKAQAKQSFWAFIGDKWADDVVQYNIGAKTLVEKNERGNLVEIFGENVDTTESRTFQVNGSTNRGWGIFAVTTDGQLHVGAHSNEPGAKIRHTSLTEGEPALGIGEIRVAGGKITAISNLSGHYKEGGELFMNWLTTSPLLTPDVLVDVRDDTQTLPKMLHMSVGRIREWISKGRPVDQPPTLEDPSPEEKTPPVENVSADESYHNPLPKTAKSE